MTWNFTFAVSTTGQRHRAYVQLGFQTINYFELNVHKILSLFSPFKPGQSQNPRLYPGVLSHFFLPFHLKRMTYYAHLLD